MRFQREIDEDGFPEWGRYNGIFFGTIEKHVIESVDSGNNIILGIGAHGAIDAKAKLPEAAAISILLPSRRELKKTVSRRCGEYAETFKGKTADPACFDYYICDDDVNSYVERLSAIVAAESLRAKFPNMAACRFCFTVDKTWARSWES